MRLGWFARSVCRAVAQSCECGVQSANCASEWTDDSLTCPWCGGRWDAGPCAADRIAPSPSAVNRLKPAMSSFALVGSVAQRQSDVGRSALDVVVCGFGNLWLQQHADTDAHAVANAERWAAVRSACDHDAALPLCSRPCTHSIDIYTQPSHSHSNTRRHKPPPNHPPLTRGSLLPRAHGQQPHPIARGSWE